jgi:hypothetical protein
MIKKFLGKTAPHPKSRQGYYKKPTGRPAWFALLVLPVLVTGGLLTLQRQSLTPDTSQRSTGGALSRALAVSSTSAISGMSTRVLGSTEPDQKVLDPCTRYVVGKAFQTGGSAGISTPDPITKKTEPVYTGGRLVIFPLIPNGIRGLDDSGKPIVASDTDSNVSKDNTPICTPPFWNRLVVFWFVYKGLAILNWLAGAGALLLTLYAGLLYITGYASENNVKTAKTLLIATYTGLIIILLAKFLVYSSINLFTAQDPDKAIQDNNLPALNGK